MRSGGPAPSGVGFSVARARVFRCDAPARVPPRGVCFLVGIVVVLDVRACLVVGFSTTERVGLFSYGGVEVFWWL